MLILRNVAMHYNGRLLFDNVQLTLHETKRYGLVGANGTGKSTFLKLITGVESPTTGEIRFAKRVRLGWLNQDQFRYEQDLCVEVVLRGKPELWAAMEEKEELLTRSVFDEVSGYRLAELEETILRYQGYEAAAFAENLLVGLGVPSAYHHKPLSQLSGGFKLRVLLAQALFSEPDLLLLDEPTNHLDIVSIAWLEIYLKNNFKGAVIFTSHDQDFLNHIATDILDIDYGEIREYVGNYDRFLSDKKEIVEQKLRERQYLTDKIAHMQRFVDRFGASAARAKQASSREKMIEKLELPDVERSSRISPAFSFKQRRPSGKIAVSVTGVAKAFEGKKVLQDIHFSIKRGEKVAIIGSNGMGKSTLLKGVLGMLTLDAGEYTWGHETHIAYFAQDHHEQLQSDSSTGDSPTVLDWLTDRVDLGGQANVRKTLGQLLFTQDEVHKKVSYLSGGEAARLLFAKVMSELGNVLVLDEPTNHLDIESRQALAKALRAFEGTVLLVSHDRHFVAQATSRTLMLTPEGVKEVVL